jgi:hypothetical protein
MLDISMPGLNDIEVCRSFKRGLVRPEDRLPEFRNSISHL